MRHPFIFLCLLGLAQASAAEMIGSVNTKFKLMGPSDKIVVEVFDDEDLPGVACYLSSAKTGGISGAVGVAEDTSDASLSCAQIGPINVPDDIRNGKRNGEQVFKKRTSLIFKTLQVVRFYDPQRNVVVYMTYSDRVLEGSPKNSVAVVAIAPWGTQPPGVGVPAQTPAPATKPGQ